MHTFFVVALILMVGGWLLGAVVGRLHWAVGAYFSLGAGIVARLAVVAAAIYGALQMVQRGGWFVLLAIPLGVIAVGAVFSVAILIGAAWMTATGRAAD